MIFVFLEKQQDVTLISDGECNNYDNIVELKPIRRCFYYRVGLSRPCPRKDGSEVWRPKKCWVGDCVPMKNLLDLKLSSVEIESWLLRVLIMMQTQVEASWRSVAKNPGRYLSENPDKEDIMRVPCQEKVRRGCLRGVRTQE